MHEATMTTFSCVHHNQTETPRSCGTGCAQENNDNSFVSLRCALMCETPMSLLEVRLSKYSLDASGGVEQ